MITAQQTYLFKPDDWRKLSDSDYHSAIMARAKDARNQPRISWDEVRASARKRIDERFKNDR